ncbi:hypothetical protein HYC85_018334 [Camellia sinensis]|uniref:Mitochondrial splicing suppressor 51-like C-terminal domain-containing protein n=1 Tax=Camellia sinensis TaxID=4442 RepID=A0A7J7GUZ7_CAMSI|nr:hypothetical protein HYC85_018334 [Camellia sinensis]
MVGPGVPMNLSGTTSGISSRVRVNLVRGLYQEEATYLSSPHVVIALNCGLEKYASWGGALNLIKSMGVPAFFTDLSELSCANAKQVLRTAGLHITQPVTPNPFRSPVRNNGPSSNLPSYSNEAASEEGFEYADVKIAVAKDLVRKRLSRPFWLGQSAIFCLYCLQEKQAPVFQQHSLSRWNPLHLVHCTQSFCLSTLPPTVRLPQLPTEEVFCLLALPFELLLKQKTFSGSNETYQPYQGHHRPTSTTTTHTTTLSQPLPPPPPPSTATTITPCSTCKSNQNNTPLLYRIKCENVRGERRDEREKAID